MNKDIYQQIREKDALFPYRTRFSLHRVIDNWKDKAGSQDSFIAEKARMILKFVQKYPGLDKPFKKASDLGKAEGFIHHLFSDVYSVDFAEHEALSISAPFIFEFLFQTEKFRHIVENIDQEDEAFRKYMDEGILLSRLIHAYSFIFHRVYGTELQEADVPLIIPYKNPETGLVRYYTEELYTKFIEVESDSFPRLTSRQIEELVANYGNYDLWLKYLPPEKIHFKGVGLLKFIDITERESVTRLRSSLLEQNMMTIDAMKDIQKVMGNFLELRDLRIGLIAFDDYFDLYKLDEKVWSSALVRLDAQFSHRKIKKLFAEKFRSVYDIVIIKEHDPFIPAEMIEKIRRSGIKGMMLAPLMKEGKLTGILELTSKTQSRMGFAVNKLSKVIPLFELAVERAIEFVHNRIQAIIKENCTAIHPSVEWKFLKKAARAYKKSSEHFPVIPQMGRIAFQKVYPLYGLFDIRDSTIQLNKAISDDLKMQLDLALDAIQHLRQEIRLRILDQLEYNLRDFAKEHGQFTTPHDGDEIYHFLESEVNPVFSQLEKDPRVNQQWVSTYLDRLDPLQGILYERRKAFEKSLERINNTVSNMLERDQVTAQEIYPHYFEKSRTDGVEYDIFIGESISPEIPFSPVYLRNLRLWQLENMVQIALYLRQLESELDIPLKTAQMLFVQNAPIDIIFKFDEKRFDVDGSFNARFEIVKKRLDKATIRDTNERLTQPGCIAIVYSNAAIISEYMDYIEYLQHKGLLTAKTEFLELNDLQGLEGMKAIRVQLANKQNKLITQLFKHQSSL